MGVWRLHKTLLSLSFVAESLFKLMPKIFHSSSFDDTKWPEDRAKYNFVKCYHITNDEFYKEKIAQGNVYFNITLPCPFFFVFFLFFSSVFGVFIRGKLVFWNSFCSPQKKKSLSLSWRHTFKITWHNNGWILHQLTSAWLIRDDFIKFETREVR